MFIFIFFSEVFVADLDNNGYLDEKDFSCLALRATIIEGKGEFSYNKFHENQHIMLGLWEEIAELADFNKVSSTKEHILIIISLKHNQLNQLFDFCLIYELFNI